jgi:hypothetical protein
VNRKRFFEDNLLLLGRNLDVASGRGVSEQNGRSYQSYKRYQRRGAGAMVLCALDLAKLKL